jgi:hypothetical protein
VQFSIRNSEVSSQSLVCATNPLVDGGTTHEEHLGDLLSREVFPCNESKDLLVLFRELGDGGCETLVIFTANDLTFWPWHRCLVVCEQLRSEAEPAPTRSRAISEDVRRNPIDPWQGAVSTGNVVEPTKDDDEHVSGGILSVRV